MSATEAHEGLARTAEPLRPPRHPKPAPGDRRVGPIRLVGLALVWLFTGFNILILYWLVAASFKTPIEIFTKPFQLPVYWFAHGDPFRNYEYAWTQAGFGHAFLITVILVAASTVTVVALAAPAAYALSRLGVGGSQAITTFLIIGIGVPFQVVLLPLTVMLAKVDLTESLFGLYVVYVGLSLPFSVFLLTGFFRSLPDELEEAAAIDGASPLRTFVVVMLPLARGGLITALTLNAIALWNETLLSLVLIHDDTKFTLSRALFSFSSAATYQSEYGGLIAAVAIVVLPMLLLYMVLARRIITGLTLGSGK